MLAAAATSSPRLLGWGRAAQPRAVCARAEAEPATVSPSPRAAPDSPPPSTGPPRRGRGQGRGGGRGRGRGRRGGMFIQSDGKAHLGNSQKIKNQTFPGPPPNEGYPLRVLPIGGLGEIGMNCMLVGANDRYILIDAGLMFPDFTDYGMQKILPDTTFLAEWKDKIEALIITHGHEDHIGALPWVVPALMPGTPVYAGAFTMQLIQRRLREFNLFDEERFHTFNMRERFQCGPFEVETLRVTHSIPDCCGLILRSEFGNIVHTGDWKIDEDPLDGHTFDREAFEQIGKEGVALLMSDSTNVLTPGRTVSERVVEKNLMNKVLSLNGKGRILSTQFASNIHRLGSVKRAADAAGRKVAFVGLSLTTYLEAADRAGYAPFKPEELVAAESINDIDPNQLLVVTTGSQGEDRAALNMASFDASKKLKLRKDDNVLYTAKVIPGNDKRVTKMFNRLAHMGINLCNDRADGLHTSGHAQKEELAEILQLVQPQHFLPVHGEASFLYAHAELAHDLGCNNTTVIRNGQMLGCGELRNNNHVSSGSLATASVIGEAKLEFLFNDGGKGTGDAKDMALMERNTLAQDGIVIAAVDVGRKIPDGAMKVMSAEAAMGQSILNCRIRVTSRGMWTHNGRLLRILHETCDEAARRMPPDSSLPAIERQLMSAIRQTCREFNGRRPEVLVVVHEMDLQAGMLADVAAGRVDSAELRRGGGDRGRGRGRSGGRARGRAPVTRAPPTQQLPPGMVKARQAMNPRESPALNADPEDLTYG